MFRILGNWSSTSVAMGTRLGLVQTCRNINAGKIIFEHTDADKFEDS